MAARGSGWLERRFSEEVEVAPGDRTAGSVMVCPLLGV